MLTKNDPVGSGKIRGRSTGRTTVVVARAAAGARAGLRTGGASSFPESARIGVYVLTAQYQGR